MRERERAAAGGELARRVRGVRVRACACGRGLM